MKNLNPNTKLDLISKLADSLKKTVEVKKGRSLEELFGAYQSGETAEEIIAAIRNARVFNRNTEPLQNTIRQGPTGKTN